MELALLLTQAILQAVVQLPSHFPLKVAFHLNQAPGVEFHVNTIRKVRNGGVVAHVRGARVGRLQRITDAIIVERVTILAMEIITGVHAGCCY